MQKESHKYLDDLWDMGRRSFTELHEEEKARLSGLLMREYPVRDQSDFLIESDTATDLLSAISAYLVSLDDHSKEKKEDALLEMKEKLIETTSSYAKFIIDGMFKYAEQESHDKSENYDETDYESYGKLITRSDDYEYGTRAA